MIKKFFMSFSSEETALAVYLQDFLSSTFRGHAQFYLSKAGILPGQEWQVELQDEIQASDALLILISRRCLLRPWINIELGAFWAYKKAVFPLIHSGLKASELHQPLPTYQVTDLANAISLRQLIAGLAQKVNHPTPPEFDSTTIVNNILQLTGKSFPIFLDMNALARHLHFSKNPKLQNLMLYEVRSEQPHFSPQISSKTELVINGYTKAAVTIHMERKYRIKNKNFLILKIKNSRQCLFDGPDELLKLVLNGTTCKPLLEEHRHHWDDEYLYPADGYFPYSIDHVVRKTSFH